MLVFSSKSPGLRHIDELVTIRLTTLCAGGLMY